MVYIKGYGVFLSNLFLIEHSDGATSNEDTNMFSRLCLDLDMFLWSQRGGKKPNNMSH